MGTVFEQAEKATRPVRLLVEGDVPLRVLLDVVDEHRGNPQAQYRALLMKVLDTENCFLSEQTEQHKSSTGRVVLTDPDGKLLEANRTGRPNKQLQMWKAKGYAVDWDGRRLHKRQPDNEE